jgi:hypothetical protein
MTHKSKSWTRIKNLGKSKKDLDLAKLFKKDDTRGRSFNASIADLELDFSKSKITNRNTKVNIMATKIAIKT